MKKLFILFFCLLIIPTTSQAERDNPTYNLVQLSEYVEESIDNNLLVVTMNSRAEANSAKEAAEEVNSNMKWALDACKKVTDVSSRTMNYQTQPRYNKKTIIGWYANQQLLLESENIDVLSSLVGTLQEKLSVTSMRFTITHARKKAATNKLTVEGLQAFRAKALLVVKTVGASDYRLVDLSIGEDGQPRPYQRAMLAETSSYAKSNMPAVQAGESKLKVHVNGTIQLIF